MYSKRRTEETIVTIMLSIPRTGYKDENIHILHKDHIKECNIANKKITYLIVLAILISSSQILIITSTYIPNHTKKTSNFESFGIKLKPVIINRLCTYNNYQYYILNLCYKLIQPYDSLILPLVHWNHNRRESTVILMQGLCNIIPVIYVIQLYLLLSLCIGAIQCHAKSRLVKMLSKD